MKNANRKNDCTLNKFTQLNNNHFNVLLFENLKVTIRINEFK